MSPSSSKTFSLLGTLQYFLDPSHTRLGFKVRSSCVWRKKTEADIDVNLDGKVALVSGANSGIGKATARGLAIRAAEVHMLCRSKERGTAALNSIKDDKRVDDSSKIHLHVVDLSEPEQIKAFAADFKRKHQKVDILVNNAAVMPNELRTNSRGTEVALATNLVGFYGLTTQLSPLLKQSQDPRIVNVVSAGMFTAKLDIPTIEKGLDVQKDKVKGESNTEDEDYSGITLYAQHHRARVDLTDYFADIYKDDGIKVNCVHPGWVDTPGLASAKDMSGFYNLMGGMLRSEEEGADTVLWLAVAKKAKDITSKYFFDRRPRKKNKLGAGTATTPEEVKKLVDICQSAFSKN